MWRYETDMKNKNSDKIIYKSQVHIWKGSNKFLRSTTIPQAKTQIIVDFLKDRNGNKKTDRIINKPQVHIWNVTGTVQTRKLWSMVIYSDMVQGSAKPSPNLAELGELDYCVSSPSYCWQHRNNKASWNNSLHQQVKKLQTNNADICVHENSAPQALSKHNTMIECTPGYFKLLILCSKFFPP